METNVVNEMNERNKMNERNEMIEMHEMNDISFDVQKKKSIKCHDTTTSSM